MASNNSKADKEETALVQLALQITKLPAEALIGDAPTDEELAALYENRLDVTRRAQLLSYISSSSEIYERWVRCVESLTYMDEFIDSSESVSVKPVNRVRKLVNWLSDLFTKNHIMGGGLSTAAVLVLVLYLLPFQSSIDVDREINRTYTDWGRSLSSEWAVLPEAKKPKPQYSTERSFFSSPKIKTITQKVLEAGFKVSMSQVGASIFMDYGIEITSLSSVSNDEISNILSETQYNVIKQIGQLSALTIIQCKIDSSSQRIVDLAPVFTQLRTQLNNQSIDNAAELVSVMEGDDSAMVCLTAQYVVDLIIK